MEAIMKRMILVLAVLMLAVFPTTAYAGGNNPNSFELDMNCSGEIVHITVPVITSNGAKVSGGGIANAFTHYIDFNSDGVFADDELVATILHGRGVKTTFCTWTWDNDPFLHGMDIQFIPPR
jgi:hypothetical protein